MAVDQYGSLATDYHWFFNDVDLFLGCDTPGVRAAMVGLEPGARVLDAACGIGIDAAALLRRGFDVLSRSCGATCVKYGGVKCKPTKPGLAISVSFLSSFCMSTETMEHGLDRQAVTSHV